MSLPTVSLELADGEIIEVFLPRLLVQAQNAEFKRDHGMFLPGVGKLHPTVKAIREEYHLPASKVRTWADAAQFLRMLHDAIAEEIYNHGQLEEAPNGV